MFALQLATSFGWPACGTLSVFRSRVMRFLGWRIRVRELLTQGCGVTRLQRRTLHGPFPLANSVRRCRPALTADSRIKEPELWELRFAASPATRLRSEYGDGLGGLTPTARRDRLR